MMRINIFEGLDSSKKISIRYHPDYANVLEGHMILENQDKISVRADEKELYDMLKMYFDELVGEQHGREEKV